MKSYYLVSLKNGASLLAENYFKTTIASGDVLVFKAIAKNGCYKHTEYCNDILDIQMLSESVVKELLKSDNICFEQIISR